MPSCGCASRRPSDGGGRRRRARADRGTTSLEFGLIGALLMAMLLGCVEVGRYMFTMESLRTATAEAVRSATIRGGANLYAGSPPCSGLAGPLAFVASWAPFLDPARLTIVMSGCITEGAVTTLAISAEYQFDFAIPLLGSVNARMTETAQAMFN